MKKAAKRVTKAAKKSVAVTRSAAKSQRHQFNSDKFTYSSKDEFVILPQ